MAVMPSTYEPFQPSFTQDVFSPVPSIDSSNTMQLANLPTQDFNPQSFSTGPDLTAQTSQPQSNVNWDNLDLSNYWSRHQVPEGTPSGSFGYNMDPDYGKYDNAFRWGSVGLSGLGIAAGVYDANRAKQQREDALKKLDASMDPNVGYYQSELKRMLSDPNGYLTDVATQNQVASARDAMLRQARAQGRSQLTAEEQKQLQVLASGAYQNRINTLKGLVGGNDSLKAARAQIAAQPSGYNIANAIPHLQDIFTTGRDYAVSQGYATPRPVDPARQARRQQYMAP